VTSKFRYRASLAETTLPEMLSTIHRFRVPGTVEARSGRVTKRVELRDGYVIYASSSDPADRLGEFLVRSGKISEDQHKQLAAVRAQGDQRFGVLLLEQKLLTPAEVFAALRAHVEDIVWSLFYWRQGEVSFGLGEQAESDRVQIQIPLRQVILQGIKRAPNAKPLVSRLGQRTTVLMPSFRWEDLIELALDADEERLLRSVDGTKTLFELCSHPPLSAADNAKLLYAFHVLRMVHGEQSGPQPSKAPVKVQLGPSRFSA
jgi:hypothetical protein